MGIFVASTLSLWYVIIFSNSFVNPPLWGLINFLDYGSIYPPILLPLRNVASQTSVKISPPEEAQKFEQSYLGPSSILAYI